MTRLSLLLAIVTGLVFGSVARGADWPQYRHDANRSAASAESLSAELHLAWIRELPTPRPAFPVELRIGYDTTYEPVVLGKTMFVPSMVTDSVTALDTQTGRQRWQYFTEGPVRLAPVAWQDKVYFVSDDGYLYCVAAADGKLLWKFQGLPADKKTRKVMGNGRLIPLVPARGGPVLADGVIYFAAGIWSGEGVFVHALDAATGKVVWSNTDSHRIERANMDHGIAYYAGLSPQGHMAIVDGKLVVPCGAQLPALLDPKTGEVAPYTMGWGGRVGLAKGCAFVSGIGKYLFHAGDLYNVREPNQEQFPNSQGRPDFKRMLYLAGVTRLQIDPANQKGLGEFRQPVLTPDVMYYQQDGIVASDLNEPKLEERANSPIPNYRRDDKYPDKMRATFTELWKLPIQSPGKGSKVHIKAGGRLYCSRPGLVEAVAIPAEGEQPKIAWQHTLQGTPHRMLAADGKLFVVTREGHIYAFSEEKPVDLIVYKRPSAASPKPDAWTKKAADILAATEVTDGYALVLGIGSGRLAEELVRQSKCDVIAVDADADKVARLRKQFCEAGLYGARISIYVGDPASYPFPPYLASLVVSEDPSVAGKAIDRTQITRIFRSLRPYGGTACMAMAPEKRQALVDEFRACELPGAEGRQTDELVLLTRAGPLPNSADWSHNGANAANTAASEDRFVEPPLARLWFDASFRWIRTPGNTVVRVAGGRVLAKSSGRLDAIDVYTGRHLWSASLPDSHGSGGEIVAVEDAIYLTAGRACVALDPATGKESARLELPSVLGNGDVAGRLTHIRVADDYLVGVSGDCLVCMNRRSGEMLWKQQRPRRVGSVALGGGKVFYADYVNQRRGDERPDTSGLTAGAYELSTGKPLWEVAGAALVRYSKPHDLLVTSSGTYRAADGTRVHNTGGPSFPETVAITAEMAFTGDARELVAYDLVSGKKSGKPMAWNTRGCTSLRAGETLLTTRYRGNAAYVDFATGKITSIWNIRAACSNNLFPANGVLNVPNLTGGCTCNYMPISQALVPVSALE